MINLGVSELEERPVFKHPYVVVLGLYRSGSSLLAGMLHHLGVHMGEQFHPSDKNACPTGSYEHLGIWQVCQKIFKEPKPRKEISLVQRVAALSHVMRLHRLSVETISGAKHPLLCALIPELQMASPDLKFVSIERDFETSLASMVFLKWWGASKSQYRDLLSALEAERVAHLGQTDHHRLSYDDLLQNPQKELADICGFLDLKPNEAQFKAALGILDQRYKRF